MSQKNLALVSCSQQWCKGILAEKLSAATFGIGAVVLAVAIFFIVLAIYLSKED